MPELRSTITIGTPSMGHLQRKLAAAAILSGPERYLTYGELDLELARDAAPLAALDNLAESDFYSARIGCQTFGIEGIAPRRTLEADAHMESGNGRTPLPDAGDLRGAAQASAAAASFSDSPAILQRPVVASGVSNRHGSEGNGRVTGAAIVLGAQELNRPGDPYTARRRNRKFVSANATSRTVR